MVLLNIRLGPKAEPTENQRVRFSPIKHHSEQNIQRQHKSGPRPEVYKLEINISY